MEKFNEDIVIHPPTKLENVTEECQNNITQESLNQLVDNTVHTFIDPNVVANS